MHSNQKVSGRIHPIVSGLLVSLALALFCLSAGALPAGAAKIVRPLLWKTTTHTSPAGPANGKITALTRSGMTSGFMVLQRTEAEAGQWLLIRIGERPNHRSAWVPADTVRSIRAKTRIVISIANRKMFLIIGGKKAWAAPVVVGKASTPTPRGLFAVHDFYRVKDEMRPWIIETTAHSEALRTFLGGPARVAIHGRRGQLRVPWGSAASNGCIRAPGWALHSIKKRAPVGTPIQVR